MTDTDALAGGDVAATRHQTPHGCCDHDFDQRCPAEPWQRAPRWSSTLTAVATFEWHLRGPRLVQTARHSACRTLLARQAERNDSAAYPPAEHQLKSLGRCPLSFLTLTTNNVEAAIPPGCRASQEP